MRPGAAIVGAKTARPPLLCPVSVISRHLAGQRKSSSPADVSSGRYLGAARLLLASIDWYMVSAVSLSRRETSGPWRNPQGR